MHGNLSMEKVTPSIQMSGHIKSVYVRIGCTLQFGIFFRVEVWSGVFGKQRMPWISCNGGLHLSQINCRWNNWHVSCPFPVDWISFIIVVMDRVHGICKYLNGDGYPLYWRVWSPYNTHHLVLLLKVMPSYFSALPISERTASIFYPACF